ncbi:bifunctional diguanylate cyclase/phosphodiesterase [Mycetocola zhadangensis]|uniref:Sensor domain-containing diguanylate cyclase n=1 Tax=Mycetocola zhadangensis TaxID=1164595 RepID=A0A3L7J0P7_9MICO|nr:sensor domain-containing diguanylate cyclase [Mycetocola zhadangensis]RLQ83929.1 sensor domain-containing diguanylate cyclase [Mycetocola zhadangensis]
MGKAHLSTPITSDVDSQTADDGRNSAELLRLDQCAREPIRTPGSIQPHGALLALDPQSFVISIVSANCADMLGTGSPLLGQALAEVTGGTFERDVRASVSGSANELNPLHLIVGERSFDAIVHSVDGFVVIELEPELSGPSPLSTSALHALHHRLARSTTVEELRADAAAGLRALTGFDQVMIYHFHPDGHGEIVADDHADGMEPYGGLHFPASDIPAQARELYLTKLSRAIVNTSRSSVNLLTNTDESMASPLDLGQAELRSVSPHHLKFMSNMGQESTLSISMVRNGELIGMITCAHRSVLRIPFLLRRGIEVLANQIALQLDALGRVEQLTRQVAVRSMRSQLMSQLAATDDIVESLLRGEVTVQDVIEADGVAVRLGGISSVTGTVPQASERELLITHAERTWSVEPFASDAIAVDHPELAAVGRSSAGVLVLRIGGNGDYLAFFRNEILRSVSWLGDQTSANRNTVLSPRNSFSSWTDSVTDTAEPWDDLIPEAAELARDLEGALLRKAESELAHLALHDALTGLPNRRNLISQLELALDRENADTQLSLLFIDLDGFKGINDSHGHDVGDSLLTLVGQRVVSATRADDLVARLGGDEFVVLCEDAGGGEVDVIASRVRASIAEPITIGDLSLSVTASVGTAVAAGDSEASDILRRADVDMYRAKARRREPARP